MPVAAKLAKLQSSMPKPPSNKPVWQGPEKDGITQSLLSRFLVCRERFRLLVIKGLKPTDTFSQRLEYGNLWHVCEENITGDWRKSCKDYSQQLCKRYKFQQEQVVHWYNVCMTQFLIYLDYWAKHNDVKSREVLFAEEKFAVPYNLPSGRVVTLRGKFDSVDIIGKGKDRAVYLQENKSKGDVDELAMRRQLMFDLQTFLYLVALRDSKLTADTKLPIAGVRYNVIRRPLAGGKHSIRPHAATSKKPAETNEEFYARLGGLITEEPAHYFMRWKCEITQADYLRFERRFLIPILEQLCDWWEYMQVCDGEPWLDSERILSIPDHTHFQSPYGIYNVLLEGGSTELDEYMNTGSETGLHRTTNLFPEL